jgi:hypothetical protein
LFYFHYEAHQDEARALRIAINCYYSAVVVFTFSKAIVFVSSLLEAMGFQDHHWPIFLARKGRRKEARGANIPHPCANSGSQDG